MGRLSSVRHAQIDDTHKSLRDELWRCVIDLDCPAIGCVRDSGCGQIVSLEWDKLSLSERHRLAKRQQVYEHIECSRTEFTSRVTVIHELLVQKPLQDRVERYIDGALGITRVMWLLMDLIEQTRRPHATCSQLTLILIRLGALSEEQHPGDDPPRVWTESSTSQDCYPMGDVLTGTGTTSIAVST